MKPNPTTILAAVSASLLLAANGDVIVPVSARQSNAFSTLRLASNLLNNTGMDGTGTVLYNHDGLPTGEPNTANNSQWVTTSRVSSGRSVAQEVDAGKVWVVFDLGASYNLTTLRVWNFNWDNTPGSSGDLNNRGISQFDVYLRNTVADTSDGTVGGTAINPTGVSDAANALSNAPAFALGTTSPWTLALSDQPLAQAPNNDTHTATNYDLTGTTGRFIAIKADTYYGGGGVGLGKVRIEGTPGTDTVPPTLDLKSPADNATDAAGDTDLVATFNEAIQAGTGNITIRKTSDNSLVEAFDAATSTRLTFGATSVTINPTANLTAGTGYYVQIDSTAIKDMAGNFFAGIIDPDTTSWSFSAETTAPTLATTTPFDDATDVAANANLEATFNEPVQAGTGNITIRKTSDNTVVESFDVASSTLITFANTKVTINPTANLTAGTEYHVWIDNTAIKDMAGNPYAGIVAPDTTTWSFTTDNTAPTATSLSPAAPTKALVGTRLLVQFNEAVQAGTGTVTVYKASDNSLMETIDVTTPGAVAINGKVAAIIRPVVLEPDTAYYVNATAGAIQDLSGNPAAAITGNTTWTFTTSPTVPLVVENFNSAVTPLNGTTADIFATAITTAGGSSTWAASAAILENGAASTAAGGLASLNLGSYIDDTKGTPAGKFELTMAIAETAGAWISLGFASSNTPSISQNFTTIGGRGSIIYRGQASASGPGELDMFGGPNNTNPVDGPDAQTGIRTLTAALDLTPAGGYNGTNNFGTVTWFDSLSETPLGSFTYTTSQAFGSLLVSLTNCAGTVNALALYQTASPTNTYANWISGFNVGTLTGPGDDFDNDGLDNAVENLFGTSPEVSSPGITSVSASGGNLKFRHTLNATPASDLTGFYEWSTDLAAWHASGASAGGTTVTFGAPVVVTPGTPDLVEITATVAGTPVSSIFARFKTTRN
jgi:methionine-rich copper-binding protein CopC